jgi:hypothetical protein
MEKVNGVTRSLREVVATGPAPLRQQVLVLYLVNSSLASKVVCWSIYDGTGQLSAETGDHPEPPFGSGLEALQAGWRLVRRLWVLCIDPRLMLIPRVAIAPVLSLTAWSLRSRRDMARTASETRLGGRTSPDIDRSGQDDGTGGS